jgi:hypothetical protein
MVSWSLGSKTNIFLLEIQFRYYSLYLGNHSSHVVNTGIKNYERLPYKKALVSSYSWLQNMRTNSNTCMRIAQFMEEEGRCNWRKEKKKHHNFTLLFCKIVYSRTYAPCLYYPNVLFFVHSFETSEFKSLIPPLHAPIVSVSLGIVCIPVISLSFIVLFSFVIEPPPPTHTHCFCTDIPVSSDFHRFIRPDLGILVSGDYKK